MLRAHRHLSRAAAVVAGVALVGGTLVTTNIALASHPEVSLTGSNFEIDTDANLKVDDASPSIDWASVTEDRKAELFTGSLDESFGNGSKENTPVPSVVDGGIPPNKSDLTHFGVYQEGDTTAGFLNMFWSRVQEPSGTTNMDFELNKLYCDGSAGDTDCTSNGLTPKRSAGDFLITYDLSQGGTNPQIRYREWNGNATSGSWGPETQLTAAGAATGSINTLAIPAGESDGLGARSPRTFGEAQIRLSALLGSTTPTNPADCRSFGSVYLKSRSSDSFTAALKDFVPPVSTNITNCGSVKIEKRAGSATGDLLNGAGFTLYKDVAPLGGTPPKGAEDVLTFSDWSCTTAGSGADAGTCTMVNVPPGQYWLVETTVPAGYDKVADQIVTVSGTTQVVVGPIVNLPANRETTLTTAQRFVPNDSATIEVADDQGALAGSMRFRLYDNATCTGTALYDSGAINITTGTANNSGGKLRRTVSSSNTTAYGDPAKSFYWLVTYTSTNPLHSNQNGECGKEASSIAIDNDTTD